MSAPRSTAALPWWTHADVGERKDTWVRGADHAELVAICPTPLGRAHADLIVRAVNHHDKLVSCLTRFLRGEPVAEEARTLLLTIKEDTDRCARP